MEECTHQLLEKTGIAPKKIAGIAFCSQMQGLVLVDEQGKALRRAMSYMDQRAEAEMKETEDFGLSVAGVNIRMLLKSLHRTHAVSTSVKDPLWKYKWVQKHEPEIFAKIYKWLDVKEYLIARMTGEFIMTPDSAYATFLYDSRPGKEGWSKELCRMYGVDMAHLPRIIGCDEVVGGLLPEVAEQLGLVAGTPVYGSGGDATLIGIGAGSTRLGDTHVYWGTSGWIGTVIDRQKVDLGSMIAGIVGAQEGKYNYFAEMETAGKCFEWVKDHLVLDEINIYLQKKDVEHCVEAEYISLYDYMSRVVNEVEPGCGGVIFTPWLHGNRCPFEDPKAAGMFFNIKLDTKKRELIRAVLEGICFHLRWMLECEDHKTHTSNVIRFVGGGSLSAVTSQMLADITGRRVETIAQAKDVGALGAALLVAKGCGVLQDLEEAKEMVQVDHVYEPQEENRWIYNRNYEIFKRLYRTNRKNYRLINQE
jgi:xylulokinase